MLNSYAKKIYSQNQEDGIIKYLLSNCQNLNNKSMEIGISDGTECNTANLIKHKNYNGILIDSSSNFNYKFYENTSYRFINRHIETNNIISLFSEYNLNSHYDLFSLDIDGIDYWVLNEIIKNNLMTASIIIVEYQDIIGPELSLTIPNISNFNAYLYDHFDGPNYCGASLRAFIKLLANDYVFVGCEPSGFNGFFVNKNQPISKKLQIDDISECFTIEKVKYGMQYRWPRTKHMEWITV